ncbi:MAG: hypothetical protein H0T76_22695 [Nannocystis sp.]|nr:hypothetical protein [Nannocystis sp.]MBA3549291.1 hypothetical protein [Nannocystis sp.]
MADAAELEFLRRTLVEPGLLGPDQLDAWRLGWPGRGSFFAHLVELGVLARADAGTLGAVFKGYVRMPPAGLLGLFKLDPQPAAASAEAPAERPGPPVPAVMSTIRAARRVEPGAPVSEDISTIREARRVEPGAPVSEDIPTIRESGRIEPVRREPRGGGAAGLRSTNAEAAARSSAGLRRADAESAGRSSPALRVAVAAAIDAALSGLPMEAEEKIPARTLEDFEDMSQGTGEDRI